MSLLSLFVGFTSIPLDPLIFSLVSVSCITAGQHFSREKMNFSRSRHVLENIFRKQAADSSETAKQAVDGIYSKKAPWNPSRPQLKAVLIQRSKNESNDCFPNKDGMRPLLRFYLSMRSVF